MLQVVPTVFEGEPSALPLGPSDIAVEGSFLVEAISGGVPERDFGGFSIGILVAVVVDVLVSPLGADEGLAVPLQLSAQAPIGRTTQRDQSASEGGIAPDVADHPGFDGQECSVVVASPTLQFSRTMEEFRQCGAVEPGQTSVIADFSEKETDLVDGKWPRLPGQPDAGTRRQTLEDWVE